MEAIVTNGFPSSRLTSAGRLVGVRRHPRHPVLPHHRVGVRVQPCRVSRLADDGTGVALAERAEKPNGDGLVERETGWQLDEQTAEGSTEVPALAEKSVDQLVDVLQARLMSDRLRHLDGKEEIWRYAGRPALVGGGAVGAMEAGVDLTGREPRGIALQVSPFSDKFIFDGRRNRPPGGADVQTPVICWRVGRLQLRCLVRSVEIQESPSISRCTILTGSLELIASATRLLWQCSGSASRQSRHTF